MYNYLNRSRPWHAFGSLLVRQETKARTIILMLTLGLTASFPLLSRLLNSFHDCCGKIAFTLTGFSCFCFRHMQVPCQNFEKKRTPL